MGRPAAWIAADIIWAALYRPPPILRGVSASQIRADHAANHARIASLAKADDRPIRDPLLASIGLNNFRLAA
jgi:hypothetical protein